MTRAVLRSAVATFPPYGRRRHRPSPAIPGIKVPCPALRRARRYRPTATSTRPGGRSEDAAPPPRPPGLNPAHPPRPCPEIEEVAAVDQSVGPFLDHPEKRPVDQSVGPFLDHPEKRLQRPEV